MSATNTVTIGEVEEASDKPFLKKYNERLEIPISTVASICAHTLFVALVIFAIPMLSKKKKDAVPIMMVDGQDESGVGSAGSGGTPEPIASGFTKPTISDYQRLNPTPLPQLKQEMQDRIQMTDPDIKIPDSEVAGLSALDQQLRDKFENFGQRKGDGNSTGSGSTGQVGSGPGGFGADSTRARSMRWVMRFQVSDGKDYLRQLSVLKATVLIPVPPENKEMMIFQDLVSGSPNRAATAKEIDDLSRQMRFCDVSAKAVNEIGSAFRLRFNPLCFFAFFPKPLEEKLAKDEENYKGRKAKDIEETIFKVSVTGNSYTITIVDQTPRKK
jgi:hypothetical protein